MIAIKNFSAVLSVSLLMVDIRHRDFLEHPRAHAVDAGARTHPRGPSATVESEIRCDDSRD